MEVKELRIGNLVTDEWYDEFSEQYRNIATVDSINSKGIDLFVKDDGKWSEISQSWVDADMPIESLRGIPITEEWLLKFGFIHDTIKGVWKLKFKIKSQAGEYEFAGIPKSIAFVSNGLFASGPIQHVHQLQNLYFALTGEELTTA
jgi:hypothetical protein